MYSRGTIQYRDRAKQLCDASGFAFGNITPTDIDNYIDYHGKCFIFIEIKYKDKEVPRGQDFAYKNLINSIKDKPAVYVVASHDAADTSKDYVLSSCVVRSVYFRGKSYPNYKGENLYEVTKRFIDKYGK